MSQIAYVEFSRVPRARQSPDWTERKPTAFAVYTEG